MNCPRLNLLHPDYKDLVIYGPINNLDYNICGYKDFEQKGVGLRSSMDRGYRHLDIINAFYKKNYETIPKLRAKYTEYVSLIQNYSKKVNEYNAKINEDTSKISKIDKQIETLKCQLYELEEKKQSCVEHKNSASKDRDNLFKEQGVIETKKQDLLKNVHKYIGEDGKIEDLENLQIGEIYYYNTQPVLN